MTEYRKWTLEEVALLKDRATSSTVQELAQELDRPVKMVRWKLKKLGLTPVDARKFGKGVPVSVWTPERLQYLRDNAQTTPVADMAEHLGLSVSSVRGALFEHKIPGRGFNRKHTAEEVEKRVAPLRGVVKVDPDAPRACGRCGQVVVPHRYPHEKAVSTKLCASCRKEDMTERRYGLAVGALQELLEAQDGCCALSVLRLTGFMWITIIRVVLVVARCVGSVYGVCCVSGVITCWGTSKVSLVGAGRFRRLPIIWGVRSKWGRSLLCPGF